MKMRRRLASKYFVDRLRSETNTKPTTPHKLQDRKLQGRSHVSQNGRRRRLVEDLDFHSLPSRLKADSLFPRAAMRCVMLASGALFCSSNGYASCAKEMPGSRVQGNV